jgi:acyl-coenzyme A thioesterase PaaI-like protein
MATYGHQAREDTMGELIVTEFVTLDGVAQAPGAPDEDRDGGFAHGGWQAPLLDQEVDRAGRTRDKRNGGRLFPLPRI